MRRIFKNQGIAKMSARAMYYMRQHIIRWEARYHRPYSMSIGQIGTFNDVRWVNGN